MLNVELQFETIAPRTLLNQVTVHLAIHQLDALMDSHVWHTTTLQPAHHAQLNLAVLLSVMILKFHFHMVFACLIHGGQVSAITGRDSQMQPHSIPWVSHAEQVTISQMELSKVELFQNWYKTSGWLSSPSWAHLSFFNKIYFENEA